MSEEKKPETISRRSFLTMLGLTAVPVAGVGLGAKKQWLQNHGATAEDLAMESILARVAKNKPDGINPENALFVMGEYRDTITAAESENDQTKQAARTAVLEKITNGEILIEPQKALTVISKYEKTLAELRKESIITTIGYGTIGAVASAIAVAATADTPSARTHASGKSPAPALGGIPTSPTI